MKRALSGSAAQLVAGAEGCRRETTGSKRASQPEQPPPMRVVRRFSPHSAVIGDHFYRFTFMKMRKGEEARCGTEPAHGPSPVVLVARPPAGRAGRLSGLPCHRFN